MRRIAWTVLLSSLFVCIAAAPASAVPPQLTSVDQENRHVTATFSAPRADDVTVYLASSPDVATNGRFLQENIVSVGSLTDSEIQSGRWVDQSQTDPGRYYVMLSASRDYSTCERADYSPDPACADGLSNIATLDVPAPTTRYTVKSELLREISILYLTLKADPLGAKQRY
ncbi:hypothetical protein [Solirubrobacter soli]|uniref:hypothetical protein n=1 Tax=Solirubrobacter soli TaxID=363832 RepID=UPI0004888631|nr:hypothetical protein [Solirubrobacter soli]